MWRDLYFTLSIQMLIWGFFLCLFTRPVSPSGLWQLGRYAVVHWNLCMPDNFCPGCANADMNQLLDETVSGVTVLVSRWAFDATSFSGWLFSCSCNRISARPLPQPGTAWWAVFYRGSVATSAAGLAEVWHRYRQKEHKIMQCSQNGQQ